MSDLNNLFWFGKKELTQDATLMWIIKNYQEDDLKDAAREILGYFALKRKLNNDEAISHLRGKQQYKDIDLAIEFYLESPTDAGWYYLIIEDKTYSYVHGNQIKKYLISAFKEFDGEWHRKHRQETHIRLIYFKSNALNHYDEYEPLREAEEASREWNERENSIFNPEEDVLLVDLQCFYENVVSNYINATNITLREYCLYTKDRYEALMAGKQENIDITEYLIGDPDIWKEDQDERKIERSYLFFGSLFSQYAKMIGHSEFWWCQYDYYHFKHFNDTTEDQDLPVIEIRSRDFRYSKNKVTIEAHLVNYTDYFDKQYKSDKDSYIRLTRKWTSHLKEKYADSLIAGVFRYKASPMTEDQKQLGTLKFEKSGKISYVELIELLDRLMKAQEEIGQELKLISKS